MINFSLNGKKISYNGDGSISLLDFLRDQQGIVSVKDGCNGQAACGACMVEIDGKARLSCVMKLEKLNGVHVTTLEGIPLPVLFVLSNAFVGKGAVQCGFCTPGFLMRAKVLFTENPNPTRAEIAIALRQNLCRCTGYVKIIDAIVEALKNLRKGQDKIDENRSIDKTEFLPKYQSKQLATGHLPFVNDLRQDGLLHAALRFSDHPRAKVLKIDTHQARQFPGVIRVFTAGDIPGNPKTGLIQQDWPLMIHVNETTSYIGDVLAGVVASDRQTARQAAQLIEIEYEVLEPVSDPFKALRPESPLVHEGQPNLLEKCIVRWGNPERFFENAAYIAEGEFSTQRIEHGFLEPESALAEPMADGIKLCSQGQGVYVDRRQVATLLGISEEKVRIQQVHTGGAFGGKEDMTVQGHVSLFAWLLKQPVRLTLSREESIRMHPKRHPVWMKMKLACDSAGNLTAIKLEATGDTGAYASVGIKVMERIVGHASGAYHIPNTDLEAKTVYTNNIPSGAMRGFGVNQVTFAIESLLDELCEKGGFDRWQFRYINALTEGSVTATGQRLGKGVGVRKTLEAVKADFYAGKYAGLACGIKNTGVGNGMIDESFVKIKFEYNGKIIISHGWSEMGQGVHAMAITIFCKETGLPPENIEVSVDTGDSLVTGMTTSSRATALLGNAIIDACRLIKRDLEAQSAETLKGNVYFGKFVCDWTTKPGTHAANPVTHFAYGYATQLVLLNDEGSIRKVIAAHDVGYLLNRQLFEGQIEGAVHMGLGYALTEDLPMNDGHLVSDKLRHCKILRSDEMPEVEVRVVEVPDPVGPYGAKGIGEIGLVPTAAAVANAFYQFDKVRRYKLPLQREESVK
ncbi:MAG: selenium-dependent xanthine dehydrogenase [Bacteroidales bacterium]|nr:selenium-dependent xanthine dehydrogenase [Bacteroidales bacterium]